MRHVKFYEDGVILAYTGYRSGEGYELTMFGPDGSATVVADNVTQYIRVNPSLLIYISDENLYSFDGKKKTLVKSDVYRIWSMHSMEVERFAGYEYGT